MGNSRYVSFLEKLLDFTKNDKVEWKYLEDNKNLCDGMHWKKTSSVLDTVFGMNLENTLYFDSENSFFSSIHDTSIVILVVEDSPAKLYIVPNTFKSVVVLEADQYGAYITRLLNLVKSKFPSGENFIDEFLNDEQ